MLTEFVNRKKEREILAKKTTDIGEESGVLIVNGISGVGKSALTGFFLTEQESEVPTVKVSISEAEQNSYAVGYYINRIASELNSKAEKDSRLVTFKEFLALSKNTKGAFKLFKSSVVQDIYESIPAKHVTQTLVGLLDGASQVKLSKVFTSTHSDSQLLLSEYIRFTLNYRPILLNIENIQGADKYSIDLLASLAADAGGSLLLMEYTQNSANGIPLAGLVGKLQNEGAKLEILDVEPLTINDLKKIIENIPDSSWDEFKDSYTNWEGNLRPLIDALIRIKYGVKWKPQEATDINKGTEDLLKSISKQSLFLLNVIFWHNDEVDFSLLKRLLTFRPAFALIFDLEEALSELEKFKLVNNVSDVVSVQHDSIRNEIRKLKEFEVYSVICQKFWLEQYNFLQDEDDIHLSKGYMLKKILFFASLLKDSDRVYELMDLIRHETLRSRNPEKMMSHVEEVLEFLREKKLDSKLNQVRQINFWLIELFYQLGKPLKSWEYLNKAGVRSKETQQVLKAILLEQIGQHKSAIDYCLEQIPHAKSPSQELAFRLVYLVSQFDIGNEKDAVNEFHFLYENKKFINCFEYGFLLRNAELVFNFRDSLPYYVKSIEFFKRRGGLLQAAYSRITYAVHLGLTGQFEKAQKQLNTANKSLGGIITEKHTILNNLGVLNLYQSKFDDETLNYFRQALLTADRDFEKVAISMNLLAITDLMDRDNEAVKIIDSIERVIANRTFASISIIMYAYFNILMFHKKRGNSKIAHSYYEKLDDIGIPENSPLWRKWLFGEKMPKDYELYYYDVRNRAVSFICNWNMEFDSNLMRY